MSLLGHEQVRSSKNVHEVDTHAKVGERPLRTSGTSRGGGKDSFAVKVNKEKIMVSDVAKVHGPGR